MADSFELVIVTPERQLLRQASIEAELPGADGCLGILPGHAPLITELGIGQLTFRPASGGSEAQPLAVMRGFAEVLGDRVTVLAEVAEKPEEIDVQRAEEAKRRAEERLASNDPDIDWDRASAQLKRSLVRLHVAEFTRKRRSEPSHV